MFWWLSRGTSTLSSPEHVELLQIAPAVVRHEGAEVDARRFKAVLLRAAKKMRATEQLLAPLSTASVDLNRSGYWMPRMIGI
jgi:hypothetical protein